MQSASANAGIQTANYGASVDKIAELSAYPAKGSTGCKEVSRRVMMPMKAR
jgi:hypothetical protein